MSRDKRAVDIMDATGASYMTALAKVRSEKSKGTLGDYMKRIDAILVVMDNEDSERNPNPSSCVHCLEHPCSCRSERTSSFYED